MTTSRLELAADAPATTRAGRVTLGLRANWRQFTLLVVVNAFVGAMVGLERAVLPIIATREFRVASTTSVMLFVATFGLTKALTNLASGALAERQTRRRVLLAGWLVALPVPFLVLYARNWWWIVGANGLLGVNQGLAWSMTVIMKIDLVGPARRGLAMGLNEFAGYAAVAAASVVGGVAVTAYGLQRGTAYPGFLIAAVGLLLSLFVRDTGPHLRSESAQAGRAAPAPGLMEVLRRSAWADPSLFSLSQAGLVNNLNDGLAWAVFPLVFVGAGLSVREMSVLAAVYPATWGLSQLATGPLSDRCGRRRPIVAGMCLQGVALAMVALSHGFTAWAVALVALGLGTALVYPTLLAAIGDVAHPAWRGLAVSVYRFWRDLGYVAGALIVGPLSDFLGKVTTIIIVGLLTAASGALVALRWREGGT